MRKIKSLIILGVFIGLLPSCKDHKTETRNIYGLYASGMFLGGGVFKRTIHDTLIDGDKTRDTTYDLYYLDSIRINGRTVYDSIQKTWVQLKLKRIDKNIVEEHPRIYIGQ